MTNIALIRRRIRDNNLIFKIYSVGSLTKSDVSILSLIHIYPEPVIGVSDHGESAVIMDLLAWCHTCLLYTSSLWVNLRLWIKYFPVHTAL